MLVDRMSSLSPFKLRHLTKIVGSSKMLDYQWVSGSYIRDTKILLDHFLYLGRMGCLFDKVYAVASNQSHVITTALMA